MFVSLTFNIINIYIIKFILTTSCLATDAISGQLTNFCGLYTDFCLDLGFCAMCMQFTYFCALDDSHPTQGSGH